MNFSRNAWNGPVELSLPWGF